MAVGRLSGVWVMHLLATLPEGIARRQLLDLFAAELVTARSHPGAKGRLALRLYRTLDRLQRKGQVMVEDGHVCLQPGAQTPRGHEVEPLLSTPLRRALFQALMAEDRGDKQEERVTESRLHFVAQAMEEGWTTPQVARALGARPIWVAQAFVVLQRKR